MSATNGVVQRSLTLPKYAKGTNVLLTAVADPGFSFAGWADAFIGTTNPLSVTLSNNITLTALFTQPIRITVLTAGMTNGAFPLWITGVAGQGGIVIEASTNLVNWIPIYTNFPSGNGFDFIDYAKTNIPIRFYRAKALPDIMAGPSFTTAVSGSAFGGAGYSFGWQFSVSVPVQITALGCFDHGGDGLGEPHLVKIWDSGGSVVCQGTASTTNRLQDGFRYTTDLNGTTWLNPGSYTIAAYFPTTSDLIVFSASRSVLTTPPEVTYGEGRYGPGTASVPAAHYEGQDEGYFGPNFLFTDL